MSSASEPGRSAAARLLVPARSAWADTLAYSRAVRVGQQVFVSGTLPVDEQGQVLGGDDAHGQTLAVLRVIEAALVAAGAGLPDLVRVRIWVRELADLPAVARAQREVLAQVRPACSVQQAALADPRCRVQIEADAVLARDI